MIKRLSNGMMIGTMTDMIHVEPARFIGLLELHEHTLGDHDSRCWMDISKSVFAIATCIKAVYNG